MSLVRKTGRRWLRGGRWLPREIVADGLPETIRALEQQFPDESRESFVASQACKSPIFIFSAGWRSGSTLFQRLVCSNPEILIWGEPFGDHVPIPLMANSIEGLDRNLLHHNSNIANFSGELHKQWIANLNPGIGTLRTAHRAHFEELYAKPAMQLGFTRWGAKWVRLSANYASYLKWLYPKAKCIFLVRHPLSAYRSYKKKKWFTVNPQFQMRGVRKFMVHWSHLVSTFLAECEQVDGFLVRYEDLVGNEATYAKISQYIGGELDTSVLEEKIGERGSRRDLRISLLDRMVCQTIAGYELNALGYSAFKEAR